MMAGIHLVGTLTMVPVMAGISIGNPNKLSAIAATTFGNMVKTTMKKTLTMMPVEQVDLGRL